MQHIRYSLALSVLAWMMTSVTPFSQCTVAGPGGKMNTAKNSHDDVVLLTVAIPRESPASEPVALSLQLKNLGKEVLIFKDRPLDTFLLKVTRKDGAHVPKTRYFEDLVKPAKIAREPDTARDVLIELEPGEEGGVTLPLNRMFDVSLHGDYFISVEARFRVKGTAWKIAVENVPFTIRAVPFARITKAKQ